MKYPSASGIYLHAQSILTTSLILDIKSILPTLQRLCIMSAFFILTSLVSGYSGCSSNTPYISVEQRLTVLNQSVEQLKFNYIFLIDKHKQLTENNDHIIHKIIENICILAVM